MHGHRFSTTCRTALLSLVTAGACVFASAATVTAELSSAAEVPTNPSTGKGSMEGNFDPATRMLTWTVTYTGLTGPATMGHFHGPAMPGANAGVVVPFKEAGSPIKGSATLTPEQAADLMAGKWYVNIHTAAHPGGEIRGQAMVKP